VKLLNKFEAAKRIGVSVSTLTRLREKGVISYLPWRPILFIEEDVERYIQAKAEADRLYKALYNPDPGTPEWHAKKLSEFQLRMQLYWFRRRIAAKRDG